MVFITKEGSENFDLEKTWFFYILISTNQNFTEWREVKKTKAATKNISNR